VIFDYNHHTNKDKVINLKSFMIGNAMMDDDHLLICMIDYAWSQAIILDEDYYRLKYPCNSKKGNHSFLCDIILFKIYTNINNLQSIHACLFTLT
jgi:serine carboxypeptidase-like clade 2